MKTTKYIIAACTAIALISCNKDETASQQGPVEVRFRSGIVSRAAGNAWAAGDQVGIFMKTAGEALASGSISMGADNRLYTAAAGSSVALTASDTPTDQTIYYPFSGSVDFIAYYPYRSTITGYSYPVNVADQSDQASIDLLWSNDAAGKNKNSVDVALTFAHKLTRIVINASAGEGLVAADLTGLTIKIKGMNTAAPFNLASGALGTANTPVDITAKTVTAGSGYCAIILPATLATAGAAKLELSLNNADDDKFGYDIPAMTLLPGTTYTWNITLARTAIEVTASITDWNDGGSNIGTAK